MLASTGSFVHRGCCFSCVCVLCASVNSLTHSGDLLYDLMLKSLKKKASDRFTFPGAGNAPRSLAAVRRPNNLRSSRVLFSNTSTKRLLPWQCPAAFILDYGNLERELRRQPRDKYGHVRIDRVKTTHRTQRALYSTYLLDLYGLLEQRFATPANKHLNVLLYRLIKNAVQCKSSPVHEVSIHVDELHFGDHFGSFLQLSMRIGSGRRRRRASRRTVTGASGSEISYSDKSTAPNAMPRGKCFA